MNFEKSLQETIQWVREHQERFWAIAGTAFLTILFIALVLHHHQTESEESWNQLGNIHGQLMQGKMDEARKNLDAWQARFPGSDAATYAKFMKADLLYRTSDYAQAAQVYGEIVQTGSPDVLKPLALSAQAASEEMAGHLPQAQALTQTFLDRYPDHFLAAPKYMAQARLAELSGNAPAAVAIYERYVLLFPQSPWTALAQSRMKTLGGSSSPQNPAPVALPH
jgi:outer membrane protein assembly factor BamD (BamD/ComL family)